MRTRILVGTIMAGLAACMLIADLYLDPAYPFLLLVILLLALAACIELHRLMGALPHRPPFWRCAAGVFAVLLANWPVHLLDYLLKYNWPGHDALHDLGLEPWRIVTFTFAAVVMAAFVVEMRNYRDSAGVVQRVALTVWFVAYLGLLPSFLVQLRWPPPQYGALTMAIFVPKLGDVAAYFTGRLLGRNRMTPAISPKKTWEGFVGGMIGAVAAAVVFNHFYLKEALNGRFADVFRPETVLHGGELAGIGFGLTVGLAGVLGDLAESMIKRDCRRKDAADTVPGFGGVLDVIDSILFAAPVAYLWLRW
ncbi:MAG TPA: phosphatidate cytidylyltransferase [Gemmataceae bacterium]|nr:phosphatidate cytidylyltransferase [Gemmataceae bacterium]